jgi:hypothetical protein
MEIGDLDEARQAPDANQVEERVANTRVVPYQENRMRAGGRTDCICSPTCG